MRLFAFVAVPFATELTLEVPIPFGFLAYEDVLAVWAFAAVVLRIPLNISRNLDIA